MPAVIPRDMQALSRWTVNAALFSGALIVTGVVAHRLFGMATPIALNLFKVGLAGAGIALLVGVASIATIWRHGSPGGVATGFGILVALGIIGWPLAYLPAVQAFPRINDITTDLQAPPRFVNLAKERGIGANGAVYQTAAFSAAQTKAYPDLRTFVLDRSAEEAYELVLAALRSKTMKFKLIAEEPPKGRFGQPGWIEFVDRTLVIGFYDDVVIRIDGDGSQSRVDVRSASRYGSHDLGRNALRVRRILKEVQAQVEASVSSTRAERLSRLRAKGGKAAVPKRQTGVGQTSTGPRSGPNRATSDAPRAPGQKERLPSRDARRDPGTRG